MNALERLVPKELETHLLLNYTRFTSFEDMEKEVLNFMEAKTGSRLNISGNFAKPSGGEPVPMDVDSLVKAVGGTIASLVGKGKSAGSPNKMKFEGTCLQCGKYGHMKKDCWQNQQGKGKGTGTGGKGKKFEGKCDNCGKVGHKKKDCWVKGGQPSGGKFKGKDKGKGKSKSANSLVQEPEPPTVGETNALELCALHDGEAEGDDQEAEGTWWQGKWYTPAEAEAELNVEDYVEVPVEEDSPWMHEVNRAVSEVSTVKFSTATFASRASGSEDGWIKCNLDTGASISAFPRKYKPQAAPSEAGGFRTASGELIKDYGKIRLRAWDEKRGRPTARRSGDRCQEDPHQRGEDQQQGPLYVAWAVRGSDHP